MKRNTGFSLIELMASLAILSLVVAAVVGALAQAQHAADGVAYTANTQQNLRSGMHFIVRDLMQAGEGVPPQGISIPLNTSQNSNLNRPGTNPATTFPTGATGYTVLPVLSPGSILGEDAKTVSATTHAVLDGGFKTDIINIVYADNTLQDAAGHYLNTSPVAAVSCPAGAITLTGSSVTLDAGCFTMPGLTNPITTGNLILFTNGNGTALEYVTSVTGQTINFAAGDPANLNGLSAGTYPDGTVQAIKASTSATTITRVWMITYYIDSNTTPSDPQLMRQINYPNYPAGAPVNPPQAIADDMESLSFSYDVINAQFNYPNGAGDAPTPILPDTPAQIRAVNVTLAARSELPFNGETAAAQYFHNNLSTQVSIRSLSFVNKFSTSTTTP
jgi:prepilin-type N-terminal cleavage/methylation domain-containing protein